MRKITVFAKTLSVFMGTIIGVGIFGLPFIARKAGFIPVFIYFALMVFIIIPIHFSFGEVALETTKIYRLPGYVGEYLGDRWKGISFIVVAIEIFGALLAYLIVGGKFLNLLFGNYFGGNQFIYTIIFFSIGSFLVFRGIKSISEIEVILFSIFLFIILIFLIKAFPFIDFNNFKAINLNNLFIPFGVVLFSLWGTEIVPEMKEMLARSISDKRKLRTILRFIYLDSFQTNISPVAISLTTERKENLSLCFR